MFVCNTLIIKMFVCNTQIMKTWKYLFAIHELWNMNIFAYITWIMKIFVCNSQVKSSHLYLYSAFNNTDCVKALNSTKLEDRVSVMYNNKIKHSIIS